MENPGSRGPAVTCINVKLLLRFLTYPGVTGAYQRNANRDTARLFCPKVSILTWKRGELEPKRFESLLLRFKHKGPLYRKDLKGTLQGCYETFANLKVTGSRKTRLNFYLRNHEMCGKTHLAQLSSPEPPGTPSEPQTYEC